MKQFCKLFGPDDDQILVKLGESPEGEPEVRLYFTTPYKGLAVCELGLGYETPKKAEKQFKKMTEEDTREQVNKVIRSLSSSFGDEE